jgi:hypothetical protein
MGNGDRIETSEGQTRSRYDRIMQIERGLHVAPFANVFALVDGPGVIGLHQIREEAEAALKVELERRASTEGRYGEHATNPVDGPDTGGEI